MKDWTHKSLVRRMAKWLEFGKRNLVVCAELSTRNTETPDVIGWLGGAFSTLIECKVTRADFLSDRDKVFRREEDRGMGDHRYFATPEGLLSPDEIPNGWGLLEVDDHCVRQAKEPDRKHANKHAECVMLMSALRRLHLSTAVYVVHEGEVREYPVGMVGG